MADVCTWQYGGANPHVSLGSDSDSGSWACNSQSQSSPANGTWTYISGGQSTSGGGPTSSGENQGTNSFGSGALQLDGGSNNPPSPPYLRIVTGQLNVRNGPDVSNSVIGKARGDGYYPIVGGPSNGWYQISYNGGTGWVSGGSAYVSVTLNQASPGNTTQTTTPTGGSNNGNTVIWASTTECPTTSTNLWNGAQVQVNGARVTSINLRAEPNLGGRVITQIPAGTMLTVADGPVCGNTWLWWRTSYAGHSGYVGEVNNEGHYNIVAIEQPTNPAAQDVAVASPRFSRCTTNSYPDGCITGADPQNAQVIYVNGINTNGDTHSATRGLVQSYFGGPTMGIYNGGISDNLGLVSSGQAYATLVRYLRAYPNTYIILVGHSQGGAIIAEALQTIAGENPSRIDSRLMSVYTFGSPARSYPNGPRYLHVSFADDAVTYPVRPFVDFCIIPDIRGGYFQHSIDLYLSLFRDFCH